VNPVKVAVVDDQALLRRGLRMMIDAEADLVVVGEAGDGAAAVDLVARTGPDVVMMDVRMPGTDGVEATRQITGCTPQAAPKVIMLTTFDLDEYIVDALRAGASGFLLKDAPPDDIVGAIRVVAAGDALLAPSVTRRLLERFAAVATATPPAPPPGLQDLTGRENEVLLLIAQGLSNAEIGGRLYLSETTIKTHVGRILMKLQLRDRVQAVVLAYETGLVRPGERAG
jgi:DNA-binding NarL/FixJ family response regulator